MDFRKPQYLKHPVEDCVLRTTWNEDTQIFKVFVRRSGEPEYEISPVTNLFTDAELQVEKITEGEYYSY
jgi:hypothetical protein